MSNPTAREIKARIARLEADLAKQNETVTKAEAELARAYAEGRDPSEAIDALSKARLTQTAMIQALGQMDSIWYEQAVAEYEAAIEAINSRAESAYRKTEGALKKALQENVAPILKAEGLSATSLEEFADAALGAAWAQYEARAADEQRALGPRPSAPLPRDKTGVPRADERGAA
jgi:hypothetical protein